MESTRSILKAEEAFAREVALGVVVTRPHKNWLCLIPGMFIFDFLSRQKAIRYYVNHYMAPRRLALDMAQAVLQGADPENVQSEIESQIGTWAAKLKNGHPNLVDVQLALVNLLLAHFNRLLAAYGPDYHQMVRSAYSNRTALRDIFNRLNELEFQRDRLLSFSPDHGQISLDAAQSQVVMRRNRFIDAIYQVSAHP